VRLFCLLLFVVEFWMVWYSVYFFMLFQCSWIRLFKSIFFRFRCLKMSKWELISLTLMVWAISSSNERWFLKLSNMEIGCYIMYCLRLSRGCSPLLVIFVWFWHLKPTCWYSWLFVCPGSPVFSLTVYFGPNMIV